MTVKITKRKNPEEEFVWIVRLNQFAVGVFPSKPYAKLFKEALQKLVKDEEQE
jgi:hypothetical protein